MAAPIEKIKALMSRALQSPFEEEARTCALTALQLISKHNGKFVFPNEESSDPKPAPKYDSKQQNAQDVYNEIMRKINEEKERLEKARRNHARAEAEDREWARTKSSRVETNVSSNPTAKNVRLFQNKFPNAKCGHCQCNIALGQNIYWAPKSKAICMPCFNDGWLPV